MGRRWIDGPRARMDSFNRMCSIEYDIELILSINAAVTQEVLVNPGLLNWVTTNMDTGQLTTNCLCVRTVPVLLLLSRTSASRAPPSATSDKVTTPCRKNNNGKCRNRVLLWRMLRFPAKTSLKV